MEGGQQLVACRRCSRASTGEKQFRAWPAGTHRVHTLGRGGRARGALCSREEGSTVHPVVEPAVDRWPHTHRVCEGCHLLPHAHELGQQVQLVVLGHRACTQMEGSKEPRQQLASASWHRELREREDEF